MADKMHLGLLVSSAHHETGEQPPVFLNLAATTTNAATDSGNEPSAQSVADKAVQDAKQAPSVWFVNFPDKSSADQKHALGDYMQDVQDYRCWASLVWWKTVYGNTSVPQDGSKESTAKRSAYCAKVAMKHMRMTPWLAMNVDHTVSKSIKCSTSQFHLELVKAVLVGFVDVSAAIVAALEGILSSLAQTIEQSAGDSETRTIVCERYEYLPEADLIKSYVRIVSFTVTDSMKNVQNAKKTTREVECSIDYMEYEATFNRKLWKQTAQAIDDEQKKAAKDFVGQQTIDCAP
ncbi:hypothetical protein M501DRAFT_1015498 [Patellaria atrata CBS 101060]|uniref:Uncharacterized protein n=1 Tax=Patellaria atrata CBS 101060 TaxID=1346257 RepID=A0A9P4SDG9_9PEZI|nr:hypothetical protein M501DRAFT_1015498 [Patellaria atrata CBS 101060]